MTLDIGSFANGTECITVNNEGPNSVNGNSAENRFFRSDDRDGVDRGAQLVAGGVIHGVTMGMAMKTMKRMEEPLSPRFGAGRCRMYRGLILLNLTTLKLKCFPNSFRRQRRSRWRSRIG